MEMNPVMSTRQVLQHEAVERFVHTTQRTDWESLIAELFDKVLFRCPYGVAAVHKKQIVKWHRIVIRANEMFEPAEVSQFVRRYMRVGHFDAIFKSTRGMERHERYDLYKIIDGRLGLPIKSLVYGIQHEDRKDLKALLVFGGERLEGQMERSLELVERILAAPPTNRFENTHPPGVEDYSGYHELIAELRDLNLKDIGEMDVRAISDLVNGLDGVIEYSPASLRAKFRTLNDHLLHRRRVR